MRSRPGAVRAPPASVPASRPGRPGCMWPAAALILHPWVSRVDKTGVVWPCPSPLWPLHSAPSACPAPRALPGRRACEDGSWCSGGPSPAFPSLRPEFWGACPLMPGNCCLRGFAEEGRVDLAPVASFCPRHQQPSRSPGATVPWSCLLGSAGGRPDISPGPWAALMKGCSQCW